MRRCTSCTARLMGNHAGLVRYDSRLPGDAVACRKVGTTRRAGGFLYFNDGVHCADVRQGFLPWSGRASMVFRLPILSRLGRGQLFRLYPLAARAIPHGMPGQRIRLFHLVARFGGAGITFLVGAGVRHFGSLGTPVAITSIAFALGLLLIPWAVETRGQHLPV